MLSRSDINERFGWKKEEHPEIFWSNTQQQLWVFWYIASTYPKKDKLIVELGTNEGACSTIAWVAAVNETGGHLITVDMVDRGQAKTLEGESNVTVIIEDDLKVGVRWDRPIDILYIDDGHEEGHVRKESDLYAPHVVSGGLVLFHDTSPGFGPDNVFNEIVATGEYEPVLKLPHTFSDGLNVARKK